MCNQRQFHFKSIPNTTVDCTFSEDFAALKRKKPSLFRSTCSSVVTLPSRLVSWDRFKGLKRQGRKDGVNIDSCLSSPEAIFSDVIRYPKLDIRRTLLECIAFDQSTLRHILPKCIAPRTTRGCYKEPSFFFAGIPARKISGYVLL